MRPRVMREAAGCDEITAFQSQNYVRNRLHAVIEYSVSPTWRQSGSEFSCGGRPCGKACRDSRLIAQLSLAIRLFHHGIIQLWQEGTVGCDCLAEYYN